MNHSHRGQRAVFDAASPAAGMPGLTIDAMQPVARLWTWQPRLPELWLRVQEGHHFRMMIEQQKEEA